MLQHSLAVLSDATDFEHFQSLCPEDKIAYSDWIIGRSERIYRLAVDYLDSTTPAYNPSPILDTPTIVLSAARERAFQTAITSATSVILLLGHDSPQSRMLSPILTCNLFNIVQSTATNSSAVARAARQILSVVRTTRNSQGNLLAFEAHCPCWGSSLLATAFGLLVQAEASMNQVDQAGRRIEVHFDRRQLEDDLDFCEHVLGHERVWPQAEMLRAELALMRTSSMIFEETHLY